MTQEKVFVGDDTTKRRKAQLHRYTHIRGYHACRPTDTSVYQKTGIMACTKSELKQSALELFGRDILQVLSDDRFKGNTGQKPQVHFSMFRSLLLGHAGHYLCYGSEYLTSIAAQLDGEVFGPYHDILLSTGIPTILICDVPIDYIPKFLVDSINSTYSPTDDNCSFWINQHLPPECIVGHEHPREIFDPLRWCSRVNDYLTCPMCE